MGSPPAAADPAGRAHRAARCLVGAHRPVAAGRQRAAGCDTRCRPAPRKNRAQAIRALVGPPGPVAGPRRLRALPGGGGRRRGPAPHRPPGRAAPPQFMVVLVAPQDKAPGWVVQASSPRQISLIPLGKAEVPADKALEFWTKADGWSGPVSLGLVQPGQPLQIPLDKLPPLQPNQLFELTLEPPTGSPIGKPTGPIQFIGRAVKVL